MRVPEITCPMSVWSYPVSACRALNVRSPMSWLKFLFKVLLLITIVSVFNCPSRINSDNQVICSDYFWFPFIIIVMETLTFDQLPKAISELLEKVSKIEHLLSIEDKTSEKNEILFSIKQASQFLNLPVSTIYGKVCRREIPVSKKGKRLIFQKNELLEWVKLGRKKTLNEIKESTLLVPKRRTS